MTNALSLLLGWLLDLFCGDPARLPHPVVWFGRAIAACERRFNRGRHRRLKGTLTALTLVAATFIITTLLLSILSNLSTLLPPLLDTIIIFYCLAGTTLIREVRQVFLALDHSLEAGRQQVARIVGRDTTALTAQEVRTAALETLAENLSDGVIAPLFWLTLLGTPGMLTYKMVNTLDSMIAYRTPRYQDFGRFAARLDDVANYVPARLTALLMLLAAGPRHFLHRLRFLLRNGRRHASPNSGYPEAALAAILDCRFGGPHHYFGQLIDKPYIGHTDRPLTTTDMKKAVRINRTAEVLMLLLAILRFLCV